MNCYIVALYLEQMLHLFLIDWFWILIGLIGSGKTLAYLLPIIENLVQQKTHNPNETNNSPRAVILVPAKELVHQLMVSLQHVSNYVVVHVHLLYGGQHKEIILCETFPFSKLFIITGSMYNVWGPAGVQSFGWRTTYQCRYPSNTIIKSFVPWCLSKDKARSCLQPTFVAKRDLMRYLFNQEGIHIP